MYIEPVMKSNKSTGKRVTKHKKQNKTTRNPFHIRQ